MNDEQQFIESSKKIKDLFPDGKKSGYFFRVPSESYNSVNNEESKDDRLFTMVKRLISKIFR